MSVPLIYDKELTIKVEAELEALGSTGDEVAHNLSKGGFSGPRDHCSKCPLAMYLWSKGYDHVEVGVGYVAVGLKGRVADISDVPLACQDFIRRFDTGSY